MIWRRNSTQSASMQEPIPCQMQSLGRRITSKVRKSKEFTKTKIVTVYEFFTSQVRSLLAIFDHISYGHCSESNRSLEKRRVGTTTPREKKWSEREIKEADGKESMRKASERDDVAIHQNHNSPDSASELCPLAIRYDNMRAS